MIRIALPAVMDAAKPGFFPEAKDPIEERRYVEEPPVLSIFSELIIKMGGVNTKVFFSELIIKIGGVDTKDSIEQSRYVEKPPPSSFLKLL